MKELRALRHEFLKVFGCEVESPATEYEAAECIRTSRFDTLLVCCQMAEEAADRICHEFRAHCPQGKIVAVVDERARAPWCAASDATVSAYEPTVLVREVVSSVVRT